MATEIYELRSELHRLRELNEQWQAQLYAQEEYYDGKMRRQQDALEKARGALYNMIVMASPYFTDKVQLTAMQKAHEALAALNAPEKAIDPAGITRVCSYIRKCGDGVLDDPGVEETNCEFMFDIYGNLVDMSLR
jgi:hypothetical protein